MIKQWTLLLLFILSIVFLSYSLVGRVGLFLGLFLALGLVYLLRSLGERELLRKQNVRHLLGQDAWGLNASLGELCQKLQCIRPEIHLKDEISPIVYSLKAGRPTGVILISTGLLKKMSQYEIEVILAYQILSLIERKSLINSTWTSVLHGLLMVGYYLDCFFFGTTERKTDHSFFSRLAKLSVDLLTRAFSLSARHLSRDERVAEVIGRPIMVANTLWKLENLTESLHDSKPYCSEHLLIVNPLTTRNKNTYFLSHPSLERRIRHLVGQYPL